MDSVKITWEKEVTARIDGDLRDAAPPALPLLVEKAESAPHPCFRMADDILLEIPPPAWRHGDVLVYLPARGWLVRRNYADHWYVDMGMLRTVGVDLFCWTDLWLDVSMPESVNRYRIHDADELADALAAGAVTRRLAARSLRSLHDLVETVRSGDFPSSQLKRAVDTAYGLRQTS